MNLKDIVDVKDSLTISDGSGNTRAYAGPKDDAPRIVGHVTLQLRERGKKVRGGQRKGKNIWTLTGREYLAQLMSYETLGPAVPFRSDRILYFGFGVGIQPEVSSVSQVLTPIPWDAVGGQFLASIGAVDFPLAPARTTVQYSRVYSETELSVSPPGTAVLLTEAGLFTDGSPTAVPPFDPGTRDTSLAAATLQAPMAYKSFEPLRKTTNFELEVFWQIRY